MALAEVYVIGVVAVGAVRGTLGWEEILAIALGGGSGCLASMWSHGKLFKD